MSARLDVELDEGVFVVRYDGRPTEAMFDAYLERYTALMLRGLPYAAVYSTLPSAKLPLPSYARRQAAWMKQHREVAQQHCRGLAFSLRSPAMRGVLHAILAMQPLGAQHVVVDEEAKALAWAKARLR